MADEKHWKIAVLPGDGIGPEVTEVTLPVLEAAAAKQDLPLDLKNLPWPATDWHRQHGRMMPEDALEQLSRFDALLLGALGDPGPARDPDRYCLPDGISLSPLLDLRKGFDLWACERPARLMEGAPQFLADERARDIDMLVIRENSEGEYVNQGGRLHAGREDEIATQVELFSRRATERLIRHAFHRAEQRLAARRAGRLAERRFPDAAGEEAEAQVCLITKRNALPHWGELYTEVFEQVAAEFPEIGTHHELVDAACMKFVQSPWRFDVVVASNLHGDILTDLAAVLSGGMGLSPSSNINPSERSYPPLFEPTHGSGPALVGEGRADPRAMMLSAALMLEWMGEADPRATAAAQAIRHAVSADLAENGPSARGTDRIARSILERVQQGPSQTWRDWDQQEVWT